MAMNDGIHVQGQKPLAELLPPGTAVLPEDFPNRIERIKEASGLSWNGLAEKLGVDPRQLSRWRKGVEPSGGAMLALLRLTLLLPEGHHLLFGGDSRGIGHRPALRTGVW